MWRVWIALLACVLGVLTVAVLQESAVQPYVAPETPVFAMALEADVGLIEAGRPVEHIFKVENATPLLWDIVRLGSSCACVSTRASSERVEPGHLLLLTLAYPTLGLRGRTEYSATATLASGERLQFSVTCLVTPRFSAVPEQVDFGRLGEEEVRLVSVRVELTTASGPISEVISSSSLVSARLASQTAEFATVEVRATCRTALDDLKGAIELRTQTGSSLLIPIAGRGAPSVEAVPSTILLSKRGAEWIGFVRFIARGPVGRQALREPRLTVSTGLRATIRESTPSEVHVELASAGEIDGGTCELRRAEEAGARALAQVAVLSNRSGGK